jgi:hypothetical protein
VPGKEIRINDRRFEVYDWSEFRAGGTSPSSGEPIVGTFKVTLPREVPVGASVEFCDDLYGIVESIGPPDQHDFALGKFLVRGSLLAK